MILTPMEAAGIGIFEPLFIKKFDVHEVHACSVPNRILRSSFSAVARAENNMFLCVLREDLPKVYRLRKKLKAIEESQGYDKALQLWERRIYADWCKITDIR